LAVLLQLPPSPVSCCGVTLNPAMFVALSRFR
jgi:hypothetical protein